VAGNKDYELTDHLGNVRATISDRRLPAFDNGTIVDFRTEVNQWGDYYAFGAKMPGRKVNPGAYKFGYQGSMKTDEIKGISGSHYTTQFRELDPRIARWWSIDPKAQKYPGSSPYTSMQDNPIRLNDPLGDTVNTSQKGADVYQEGAKATLGKDNPFGYDKEKGILTFNQDYDKDKYSEEQQQFIENLAKPITAEKETDLEIVSMEDKIVTTIEGKKSLKDLGLYGATINKGEKVYIAENPQFYDDDPVNPGWKNLPKTMRGVGALHELGSHVRLYINKPKLSKSKHNDIVEQYETNFRQFYRVGTVGALEALFNSNKERGNPKYMGGEAKEHDE
jgi:RHS repeat-associated protein